MESVTLSGDPMFWKLQQPLLQRGRLQKAAKIAPHNQGHNLSSHEEIPTYKSCGYGDPYNLYFKLWLPGYLYVDVWTKKRRPYPQERKKKEKP